LNAVCLGQFRIHAKASWFDRTVVRDEVNGRLGERNDGSVVAVHEREKITEKGQQGKVQVGEGEKKCENGIEGLKIFNSYYSLKYYVSHNP
jgi:hypothetical protein